MRGWLVVNGFLRTEKFETLYTMLKSAAWERGIGLELKTGDSLFGALSEDKRIETLPDFAIFWDKDIYLARRLESIGVRLFNSAAAVETCDNKIWTALALQNAGLPVPETFIAPKTFEGVGYGDLSFLDFAGEKLGYPLIVKEAYGSFGAQVYLANNRAEAKEIVEKLGDKEFLMQEFIAGSRGKDLRVNVVGEKVVCAMLRVNENDFRSNITGGGKATVYALSETQEKTAIAACRAVGAEFAGVDILFGKEGKPIVCEVNSNPHFKSTLDCTGIDLSKKILGYIAETL